jgi:molecular chaperone DnaK (HSP70)
VASPFIVGIDLGTTNCALADVDTREGDAASVAVRDIVQLVNPGEAAPRTLLPSFLFLPGPQDFPKGATALPWGADPGMVAGELARRRGAENPSRLVASAKSWLSHAGIDRASAVLPWQAPEGVPRLSPVAASAAYLAHLAQAWAHGRSGKGRALALADQDVLVTVPASFDEEARELTLRAAGEAGLAGVRLLEEPQAAFYAWLASQGEAWRERVAIGDLVLVCDIGGGTTDFSLIAVAEEEGSLVLRRVAVGDHILLGGDNMDLALARMLQQRLEAQGHRIDGWQLQQLWHQCRGAKERLFEDETQHAQAVTVLGRGSKLVGGTITTELTREDLSRVLVDGFFPSVPADARPQRARRVGLQELGLPYAADAAITRHLARFLGELAADSSTQGLRLRRGRSGLAAPTHVLFNGGVMKAPALRTRIVETLDAWLEADGLPRLGARGVLDAPDLDHAVARGAAYYGLTRRGRGVRIRGGASRTYYVGIESAMPAVPGLEAPLKALCVVPFGMEEGSEAVIGGREFGLVVGEPAEFRFLASASRKQDQTGELIEDWGEQIEELHPLEVTLTWPGQEQTVVPVRLESRVTELGTLELWLVARDDAHRWKLEWNIREKAARPA